MDDKKIVIIAKGKNISSRVKCCDYNDITGKWDVIFNDDTVFHYSRNNIVIYRNVLNEQEAKSTFEYLREIAEYTGIKAQNDNESTENDKKNILSGQYNKIDFLSDNTVAAVYLNPDKYSEGTGLDDSAPIFPFGCNESQFQAVKNALANRISVIEGPPGTGKTQTILNIIANLVLQGKTVQIVSNNNSAIDNVLEKLGSQEYGLDFIVARLGSNQRKDDFIVGQTGQYPEFLHWQSNEYETNDFNKSVKAKSLELQEIFKNKNYLAELRKEKYHVQIEYEHLRAAVAEQLQPITRQKISSSRLMEFWLEYQDIKVADKDEAIIYKAGKWLYYGVRWLFIGINIKKVLAEDTAEVASRVQYDYYRIRLEEIDSEITNITDWLDKRNASDLMTEFTDKSLKCFRSILAKRYSGKPKRRIFTKADLLKSSKEFLWEYPVVLSTNYTARSSLGHKASFDYVIMDESSQADVATGLLAVSCAKNAVIVGDSKQLPNVVTTEQKKVLNQLWKQYDIAEAYNFAQHSFLSSICLIMGDRIPRVTLLEHYRCHPQIIGFCNQKFYNGDLIVMTNDDNRNSLKLVTTVPGNHVRNKMNQRQADVICNEILPKLDYDYDKIGIIAPYRNQVNLIRKAVGNNNIDIDTVHKFQGREKDVIIISTVDDVVTEFSDNPNLLNVAISRAQRQLIVVAGGQEQPTGSNIADLIGYIRYNNCDIYHSEIRSVFDYLYSQYAKSRMAYLKKHKRISEYDSENLMYIEIIEVLKERADVELGVICHHPLQLLFRDLSKMNDEERRFVNTGLSHLDFLIYNKVSKQPILGIEVDGVGFHKEGTRQEERDKLKNHIMEVYGLPLLRFRTDGSEEKAKLRNKLDELFMNKNI